MATKSFQMTSNERDFKLQRVALMRARISFHITSCQLLNIYRNADKISHSVFRASAVPKP